MGQCNSIWLMFISKILIAKFDSLEGMSTVTAGPDIIPHIDNELDHSRTDMPSFLVISGPQWALHKDFCIKMPLIWMF